MSTDRKQNNGGGSSGKAIPEHPSDPIARNPKDVDEGAEDARPARIIPGFQDNLDDTNLARVLAKVIDSPPAKQVDVTAVPVSVASTPVCPEPSGPSNPQAQVAASSPDLLTSILRFKRMLIAIVALAAVPIIALIWTQITPQYQARAEIRVRPIIPRLVFKTDENGMIPLYDSFVNTQVSLIRSLTVLQRVLDQQDIQATKWYKNRAKTLLEQLRADATPPLERLRTDLSVRPRPRTEIIDVSLTASSDKEARLIVDALLKHYTAYVDEKADATEDKLYRQLVEQYKSLETEIQGREKVCSELHRQLGTETPQELISARRVHLDAMQARLGELQNARTMLEWQISQVAAVDPNGVLTTAGAERRSRYYQDEDWRRLDIDVKKIEHQIVNGVYKPGHPNRIRMEQDRKFLEELRRQREGQLDEQWRDRMMNATGEAMAITDVTDPNRMEDMASAEPRLARVKHEEQLLQAEFEKQQGEFQELFATAQLLEKQAAELRSKRDLFGAVQERLNQKNIERNVPGSIDVLTWAYSPSHPVADRRIPLTVMTLFAALGMGVTATFLKAGRNQDIYAVRDMPQQAQIPFLGQVPVVNLRKPVGKALSDEIEQKQQLLVESVRMLRTALLSRLGGRGRAAVLVTSANEGTGKSSFTIVMGKSIAQTGRKVLVIDADLHKTALSRRLQVADKLGLRESLKTAADGDLHLYATETAGLDVMPAGRQANGNVVLEEIANSAFKNLISRLFEQYGYSIILLDSPPILPVADATIMAGQVDGAIMVEREHVSRRSEVANALLRLNAAGGRLLGTVFVGSPDPERYGYGRGYGYGYGHAREGHKQQ